MAWPGMPLPARSARQKEPLESWTGFRLNRSGVHRKTPTRQPHAPRPHSGPVRPTPRTRRARGFSDRPFLRDLLLASGIFAIATVVLTYPLAIHPTSLGRFDNGDARLNAWAMSWVANQLIHDPLHLFQANTFYPLPNTLAFSEHLFVPGLMTLPLLQVTNDLVLSYNVVFLFSIFLSAVGMYVLTVSLTGSRLAGIVAGLLFSFAPYRFNRLPHIQMQLYAFLPLALACLHRFLDTGKRSWAWCTAGFFLLQVLSGTYLAAMATVALSIALVTMAPTAGRTRQELSSLALALVVAALCIYPFARPYFWVNDHLGVEWDLAGIGSLSATPESYLASSSRLYRPVTDGLVDEDKRRDFLFPGLTLPLLGLVGLVVLVARQGNFSRPWATALCFFLIMAAGVLLSLGPLTPIYSFLHEHLVFFRGLRALTRFALLPLLSLSVLAGFALAWIFEGNGRLRNRRWAAAAIAIFFVAESTALPYSLETFHDEPPEVYLWLEEAEPGPIVELPFLVLDTRYMFWARHHGFRPMLNGDSGFVPPSHRWMKNLFLRFPSPDSITLLQELGVRYVILHLGAYRDRALIRLLNGLERHRAELLKIRHFGRDMVVEVMPPKTNIGPPPPHMVLSAIGPPTRVVPDPDEPLVEFVLSLSSAQRVTGVRLHYGRVPLSPVTHVELQLPALGEDVGGEVRWEQAWASPEDWPALTELVQGLLEHPRHGSQYVEFRTADPSDSPHSLDEFVTDRLRLRLTGYDGPPDVTRNPKC